MTQNHLVAVDQSTQSTKAFLVDGSGSIRAKASLPHRQIYPASGRVEHDPLEILTNTCAVITKVIQDANLRASDIACIGITNQRETIVAWDRLTGLPIHNALVWQDERGAAICRELSARGADTQVFATSGLRLDPYFSASKLAWLVQNVPAAAEALAEGRLMAGTMDAWLVYTLTQGQVFATDYSNASRTMLFNIHSLAWDADLLALFGLQGLLLPSVFSSDAHFGEAILTQIEYSIPIHAIMGDSHAALFGHCGWKSGDAKATYGTGSSLMTCIGDTAVPPPAGCVLSLAWGFQGKPSYVFEGNIHATGYTLAWLKDKLGLFQDDDEAMRLAAEVPDSGGVYLVPAFSGLGAPWWEHGVRAIITGLSHGSDRRHIIRAGIESIAFQVMDLVTAMNAGAPAPLAELHVDGGPTRNTALMQFQADMLGIPVVVPARQELSALGVAWMAGLGCGFWHSPEDVEALAADATRYVPAMPEENRQFLSAQWSSAVRQTLARRTE